MSNVPQMTTSRQQPNGHGPSQDVPETPILDKILTQQHTFVPLGEEDEISLSAWHVYTYIAKPTKLGAMPTNADCIKFAIMCRQRKLNPWTGDCYLLGYDTVDGPQFSIVTAHQALLARAEPRKEYEGMESGVIVLSGPGGEVIERQGDLTHDGEILIGGWARVYRSDRKYPSYQRLKLSTYDKGMSQWKKDREGMICKCAEAAALRQAFPSVIGNMYLRDEIESFQARQPVARDASSMEELTQHITQSLDRSPEQQATDGGSKPRAARGRRGESSKSSALGTKAEPVKELAAETAQASEAEEITSALDPPAPKKATKAESKPAAEPAEQPADLKNIPDAELKEKIDRAVKYMKTMYGARCEGFDLNLIALSSSEAPSWAVFCKSVIEKQKPGWENYLLTDSEENEEIPEDDASQEIPETSDQLPESIENPVQRPAMIGSHARAFEVKIQSLKQAKRIRDLAKAEISGHPELLPEEQNYLESLADRRAWYIEHGQEPAKERQIPE